MPQAVIIAEDFAGMLAQGRGLAERAGMGWVFCPVFPKKGAWQNRLPVSLWRNPLAHIQPVDIPADTEVIISIGGRGGRVGAALGKNLALPVIQVQNPRHAPEDFDLVIVSTRDRIRPKDGNILTLRTALHPVTPAYLNQARKIWKDRLDQVHPRHHDLPLLAVLLGGDNGRFRLGPKEAGIIAAQIEDFLQRTPMRCIMTSSRRTSPEVWVWLQKRLSYRSSSIAFLSGEGEDNPYPGLLACADLIAVTTDSVSMISESVATNLPVGILPLYGTSGRITDFVEALKTMNRVEDFHRITGLARKTPLDDTPVAAKAMLDCLGALKNRA